MFIKSIVIDGFKSYAKRTEVTGFDPAFNAITGLNGSGKSNILDAICFLLGLTNLSQVRASNLQDLVYKSGQAGIDKATVSIVFDNRDKKNSPIGYDNFDELTITRQIVVGGKNKYLINGITATNQRVGDLFRSVQLNVNNPHFLIMQGRITKVLNMKPPEILSLLEEAASTKNYENKRETTLATIEKKEYKLKEINNILHDEINPKLHKLREERTNYNEYQRIDRELQYLNKFIIAEEFTSLKKIVDNFEGELEQTKNQQNSERKLIDQCEQDRKESELEIEKLIEEKTASLEPIYQHMDKQMDDMKKDEAILKNSVQRNVDSIKCDKDELRKLGDKLSKEETSSNKIRKEIDGFQSQYETLQSAVDKSKKELESARKNIKDVNMGLYSTGEENTDSKQAASLSEILRLANKHENNLEQDLRNLNRKVDHYQQQLNDTEAKLGGMSKTGSVEEQQAQYNQLNSKLKDIQSAIDKLGYSDNTFGTLQDDHIQIKQNLRELNREKESIIWSNNRFEFNYKRPYPNFNDKKILGVVSRLARLKSDQFNTAMEIIGGAKLFNVIVETDDIAADLFKHNCLSQRVTMLPLNIMRGYVIPDHKFRTAQQYYGNDKVWHPLHLLEFDEHIRPAMNHVFGSCLIASDLNTAKAIAFDKRIGVRCVTLEGDLFDPEGTLVGGSSPQTKNIFQQAQKLNNIFEQNSVLSDKLKKLENELDGLSMNRQEWDKLNQKQTSLMNEITKLESSMMGNTYLQLEVALKELRKTLAEIKEEIKQKEKALKQAHLKTVEAKNNLENSASVQEKAKKDAQKRLDTALQQLELKEQEFNGIQNRYETLEANLKANEEFEKEISLKISEKNKEIEEFQLKLNEEKSKLSLHQVNMAELERDLLKQKSTIDALIDGMNKLRDHIKDLIETKDQASMRLENVTHTIECIYNNGEDAGKKIEKMLRKYAWINEEKHKFGVKNSEFDFDARSRRVIDDKMTELEDQKQKLSRKVDLRGMNMLAATEQKYKDLVKRYEKVLDDKQKLQKVIQDLDKLKDEVIEKAHIQVDKDFNKIFSTLLPGSQARLVPPENKILNDGLEFRIAFGNVWKESLNELSGGQRSLVALSLILALLRFKPAPLYILDEVDAALDISHTQNIGTIIREQFANSQFVIVSLKEGMFNNANVLFKTKFVDGISTVSRQVNQSRRPLTERN